MSDIRPRRLGGEIDPRSWDFEPLGQTGPLPNPVGHTFPLITHDENGRWRLIGTGFYVSDSGFFVTAKHVIEEVYDGGRQRSPLLIVQLNSPNGLFGASEFLLRPIKQCWLGDQADVAFGVAAPLTNMATGQPLKHWCWTLSLTPPDIGIQVATYAFPNHAVLEDGRRFRLAPHAFGGRVDDVGDRRDSVMVPFPFIQVSTRIHGAASGGPVIAGSHVVGINCTEYVADVDHPAGPGFGAQSRCLTDAFLDDVVLPGESVSRRVTFHDLARAGCLSIADHAGATATGEPCGRLVFPHMPPTAARPALEVETYV
jgi:hypothetical protein